MKHLKFLRSTAHLEAQRSSELKQMLRICNLNLISLQQGNDMVFSLSIENYGSVKERQSNSYSSIECQKLYFLTQ